MVFCTVKFIKSAQQNWLCLVSTCFKDCMKTCVAIVKEVVVVNIINYYRVLNCGQLELFNEGNMNMNEHDDSELIFPSKISKPFLSKK